MKKIKQTMDFVLQMATIAMGIFYVLCPDAIAETNPIPPLFFAISILFSRIQDKEERK